MDEEAEAEVGAVAKTDGKRNGLKKLNRQG